MCRADVRQGNLRMFIRSNIRKLPVTTSAHPQICILLPATGPVSRLLSVTKRENFHATQP